MDAFASVYALPSVRLILANLCHPHGVRVERQPICWDIDSTDVLEQLSESPPGTVPIAEQVDVARWTVQSAGPEGEKKSTFEDELAGAFGLAQSVQKAFNAIPRQREAEILATVSAQNQQPLANGSWEIGRLSLVHAIASLYGLMTFATRQTLA